MGILKKVGIGIAVVFVAIVILGTIGAMFTPTGRVTEVTEKETTTTQKECIPNWQCGSWSECSSAGIQTRTCSDLNNCGTVSRKPVESQSCTPPKPKYPLELTVNSVRTARVITGMGGAFIDAPKEGEIALIVDFSIKNVEVDPHYEFNPNFMKVIDSKGYSYGYSWDSASLSKYFDMSTIPKGQVRSGELAFNVAETETKFALVAESFLGGYQGYVEFIKS